MPPTRLTSFRSALRAPLTMPSLPARTLARHVHQATRHRPSFASSIWNTLTLQTQCSAIRSNLQSRSTSTLMRKPQEPEEPEVYRDGEPTIIATERAINQLRKVSERENNPNLALRIAVEPGGCHGYQYKMELTQEVEDDDFAFEVDKGIKVYVDSISLALVRGSTVDYVTELIGSQFSIKDNPQAKGAGCGCGVSWEPIL